MAHADPVLYVSTFARDLVLETSTEDWLTALGAMRVKSYAAGSALTGPSYNLGSEFNTNAVAGCAILAGGTQAQPNMILGAADDDKFGGVILSGYDNIWDSPYPSELGGSHNRGNVPTDQAHVSYWRTGSLTGTISSSGTAVTGSGTAFVTELKVGDVIRDTAGLQPRRVATITSNTALTTDTAFSPALSGAAFTRSNYSLAPDNYVATTACDHTSCFGHYHWFGNSTFGAIFGGRETSLGRRGTTEVPTLGSGAFSATRADVAGFYNVAIGGVGASVHGFGSIALSGGWINIPNGAQYTGGGGQSLTLSGTHSLGWGASYTSTGNHNLGGGRTHAHTCSDSVYGGVSCSANGSGHLQVGQQLFIYTSGSNHFQAGLFNEIAAGLSQCGQVGTGHITFASLTWQTGDSSSTNKVGQAAQATGRFAADGDAQTSVLVARRQTTDATPTDITLDGTANAAGRITVNSISAGTQCAVAYEITVIAKKAASVADVGRWKFQGIFTKGANNAATAKVAGEVADTPQLIGEASSAPWSVAISADTTNGVIKITATGAAGTTIRWVARIVLTEVTAT